MPKVFITRPIPGPGPSLLKEAGYDIVINEAASDRPATKEEILSGASDADAILSVLTEKIDSEILDSSPNLKIVANYAVGFDNIDLDFASQKGVLVTNTPDVLTNTVAEHTFALMLAIAHRVSEGDRFSRAGKYSAWGPSLLLGNDLSGKVLGVIGLGRIGARVSEHAYKGFGMKINYYDIKRDESFESDFNASYFQKIEEMLPECDFLSLHVPLLDSTRHLINKENLSLMKKSAYLVNTSRGPVIDEAALAEALKGGVIKGAAIDVFENEPDINKELISLDNIIITPHIASATEETRSEMSRLAAENIIAALSGKTPPNLVRPKK